MNNEPEYIGTYKVFKVFRISGLKAVLARDLTLEQAKRMVNSYGNSSRSMVCFTRQFYANKYYRHTEEA